MPGPAPKRPQNRSRLPRAAALTLVPSPERPTDRATAVPEPPGRILPRIRALWTTFWQSPLAAHVIDSDRGALERLFRLYDQRERYLVAGSKLAMTTGSTGQLTLNPLIKQVDVLDGKILALEDRFGLSPMARLKLQVTLGDASRSLADLNAALGGAETGPDEPADDPREAAFAQ